MKWGIFADLGWEEPFMLIGSSEVPRVAVEIHWLFLSRKTATLVTQLIISFAGMFNRKPPSMSAQESYDYGPTQNSTFHKTLRDFSDFCLCYQIV